MSEYPHQNDDSTQEQHDAEILESALHSLQQEHRPAPADAPEANALIRFAGRLHGEVAPNQEIDPAFSHSLLMQLERRLHASDEIPSEIAQDEQTSVAKRQPTKPMQQLKQSRRAIIAGGLAAAASFAAGFAGKSLTDQPQPAIDWNTELVGLRGVWTQIGAIETMPAGSVTRFSTGQIVGHLIHRSDGTLLALSAACTHMGCIVHWNGHESTFDCPCHGWRYTEEGAAFHNTTYRPLPKMYAKVEDGIVYVFTPAPLE